MWGGCNLPISVGTTPVSEVHSTQSLLKLASFTPLEAESTQVPWSSTVTPYKIAEWERGLASHPDQEFVRYVCSGIREGFRIGYDYHQHCSRSSKRNMKSALEHRQVVESYLGAECEAKRLVGPLKRGNFPQVHTSPFGVIPKSEPGKWRLIVDLSSPYGKSINDGISKEPCSVSYLSIDEVASWVVRAGRGALMAKFDLKSAYRQVPVHPDDRKLLGMEWEGHIYVDTTPPFGLRSAPTIFSAVADALAHMIRQKMRDKGKLGHYLDDYVVVTSADWRVAREALSDALQVCETTGSPVAEEKTEGPATEITLLGIKLDSVKMQLRLPSDKLRKLRELVEKWRRRKACQKRELQSLAGYLCHACKVVRPGRRFLRGVFSLLSQFRRDDHVIRLNAAFRADLEWWHACIC